MQVKKQNSPEYECNGFAIFKSQFLFISLP